MLTPNHLSRRLYLAWRLRHLNRYLHEARRCDEVQRDRLMMKIRLNADSEFGKQHGFAKIRSVDDFRRQVPIANYETYRPWVERVKNGEIGALFGSGTNVLMFSMTSGTTSQSKYVPITDHFFREYRQSWNYWGLATFRDHPDLLSKYALTLASDWDQFRTSAEIPCGSISGLVAETRPRITNRLFLLPTTLLKVHGTLQKQYAMLRIAIASDRVGMVATANPLTLINLSRLADEKREQLIRDIHDGTLSNEVDLPNDVREQLSKCWNGPNPKRAAELESIIERSGHLYPREFWPNMSVVSVWMGGSVSVYLPTLREYFGDVPLRDHGLSASEGHMTSPMEDESNEGLLDYQSHFFEFIPVEERDSKQPNVLEAHELREGGDYYLLMSTLSGMYRYDIHDVVRCTGFVGKCPKLLFLNKGSHFSSLTGEKLSEVQVTQAISNAMNKSELNIEHFSLVPVPGDPAYYLVLTEELLPSTTRERLAAEVDRALCEVNCEYEDRRTSRRLDRVVVGTLPTGTWAEHRRERTSHQGADTYAYKHPFLAAKPDLAQRFRDLASVSP
ncbi:MAG: GH3 auxin-responsive promoter family protein [Planctomycetota bacterium]